MYDRLEQADEAAGRMSSKLFMDVEIGETLIQGVQLPLTRRLCAIGAGYADWRDLEMRVGTPDAVGPMTPLERVQALLPVARDEGLWDHPLTIESLLYPTEVAVADPAEWMRESLELLHAVQEDVSRLEAAESVFDYVRLASDPAIGDVELATLVSIRLGLEVDGDHLRALDEELSEWQGPGGRVETAAAVIGFAPWGPDDWTRMALCGRVGRISPLVHDMDATALADLLVAVCRFISAAGGATNSGHTLARLAVLRPRRGTWRDEWVDQI